MLPPDSIGARADRRARHASRWHPGMIWDGNDVRAVYIVSEWHVVMLEEGRSFDVSYHVDNSVPKSARDKAKVYSVYFRKHQWIAKGRDTYLDIALMQARDESRKLDGS